MFTHPTHGLALLLWFFFLLECRSQKTQKNESNFFFVLKKLGHSNVNNDNDSNSNNTCGWHHTKHLYAYHMQCSQQPKEVSIITTSILQVSKLRLFCKVGSALSCPTSLLSPQLEAACGITG